MANTRSHQLTGFDWLAQGPLAPHVDAFKNLSVNYVDVQRHLAKGDDGSGKMV